MYTSFCIGIIEYLTWHHRLFRSTKHETEELLWKMTSEGVGWLLYPASALVATGAYFNHPCLPMVFDQFAYSDLWPLMSDDFVHAARWVFSLLGTILCKPPETVASGNPSGWAVSVERVWHQTTVLRSKVTEIPPFFLTLMQSFEAELAVFTTSTVGVAAIWLADWLFVPTNNWTSYLINWPLSVNYMRNLFIQYKWYSCVPSCRWGSFCSKNWPELQLSLNSTLKKK